MSKKEEFQETNVVQVEPQGSFLMPQTKKEKVFIVGFAPSWSQTPWDDMSAEIWGLNELYKLAIAEPKARFDRWFEIHNPKSPSKNNPPHQDFLKNCQIPLYMQKHYDEFPKSIEFPLDKVRLMINECLIKDDNGSEFTNWSNQISYMIGFAILEGFKEIHVYGVDMATTDTVTAPDGTQIKTGEYVWQRPSVDALVMFAAGRGIKVKIPQSSELIKGSILYGYDSDNQTRIKLKEAKKEYQRRMNLIGAEVQKKSSEIEVMKHQISQLKGSIDCISWMLGNNIV